jgi:16S rRNA (guanine966-N2)-methyltransferase
VLRIIGGTWRGRKLRFPDRPDLRPTPDRVRETLFNWLGPRTLGARCLDLFAGSGALGLEALSRGAAHVSFIERDPVAARELRARLTEWQASGGEVECADALQFLDGTPEPSAWCFDPPTFRSPLLLSAARRYGTRLAAAGGRIYVESPARGGRAAEATLLKAKQAGEVGYHLYAYSGGPV